MRPISPLWLTLLLFCLPLLASLPISQLLGGPLAHQLLQDKKMEVETALAERHRLLDNNIRHQLTRFQFDCGRQDMALLRDPRYYNSHIRIQGILLAAGGGCSSLGLDLPFTPAELPPYANQEQFGIAATQARFHTEQELVAYYRTGGNIVYWVLNNSWSHALLQTPCSNCFYLEFGQQQPGASSPIFPRGDSSIKQEEGSQSLSFFDPNQEIRQTLWAGRALEHYAQQQARHDGLWLGAAVGTLLVAAYWGLRNYRRSLKGLLQAGLARREFVPFYQPVIDSRSQQVVGFEALLRWQRGGGLIPPGAFIDYAEEQQLILPMTSQLLERVIADLPRLAPGQWVSVNIVAAHLEHPHLRNLLLQHGWPSPAQLTFELTERKPITDIKTAVIEITALQQQGYHFKLDDFGTGYGGFAYLQRLGIRQIKIDKMFVDTIGTDDLKRSVLDATIAFGRESGMEMIAEGVERQEQVDYLQKHGVHLIQGYVYAPPMALTKLKIWLLAWYQNHTGER
ncbi:diguanylate phosphodiesterase [Aeromonas caviae]|uniref:EAL domain-containing protein n=1 Tax=Aeromonas hydrophila TaxID=644 RepID=A0AAX3P2Z4_AERHY|nr:EAL domain-containing protein [Aeromonas hydrophila]GKQ64382.1 diguanylate phosphodiesterase [Aeromonas caviae]HDT5863919.1 EAL domain-containing protein [Aeromonas hydrophila subsp. hydrophila]MCV9383817.1 EAL domain-containing protein [Aeromonas hydrophila]WEE25801.1 EAL domain-containing protein [Aeromonas hydrophila]BCK61335.1 diguanylate phosphodiesterase [Aeromonas hydrophila]